MRRLLPLLLVFLCIVSASTAPRHSYLFVWIGDDAKKSSDFLAVVDADSASPKYGQVLATLPTGSAGTVPHHTEGEMPANGYLLANGFEAGRTFLFDLRRPLQPKLVTSFGALAGYDHPHTFVRLRNGHVLATFQFRDQHQTGGLVEFTQDGGRVFHSGSAADPHAAIIEPYSVTPVAALDRALSTSTSMMHHDPGDYHPGKAVQLWRLSDLKLLRTFELPPGPRGDENQLTGEPVVLPDGRSVYVHTFQCGLYLVRGLENDSPRATFVHGFEGRLCAVPIQVGHWWLQTVPQAHAVVALDIADPEHPREVSRVTFDDKQEPHWMALEPGGRRVVVNSGEYADHRLFIVNFDPQTGALALDERFRDSGSERPGVSLDGKSWPHGFSGNAYPHGTVFSR